MAGEVPALARGPFSVPVRKIMNPMDMDAWERSEAQQNLTGFILAVAQACTGVARSSLDSQSSMIDALSAVFVRLQKLVDDTPPVEQPRRFGNAAFVTWLHGMEALAPELVASVLPAELQDAAVELVPYFTGGFGNEQRRDYGTGHELSFVAFLGGLALLGALPELDYAATALVVFGEGYLGLVRRLQTVYNLEPAGSRGAFGLDDYQFMPFLWGAFQLIGHGSIVPGTVTKKAEVALWAKEYLYLGAVEFICSIKTGPFEEHSACLHSITAVVHWKKISEGMVKMYKGEVLRKFPVVQHFVFGSLYTLKRAAV